MTQLCLVRHGQTDWNLEGRYQGQSDVPLNENGRIQAQLLARQLQDKQFEAIFTSDLQRAKETAEILAAIFHLPVNSDPRLREIHQGEWEGQQVDDIKSRYANLWNERMEDPANVRPPGGETVAEVARRVHAALNDIATHHANDPVMVVSHGLAIATALCKINGIPIGQAYTLIPDNADPIWAVWDV
ncbi:MAG: alpha-ribazole phosphatase [Anaerolineaceae bacterium]|nr:alpha-ribazole phosphatase [Anaerolineaceae bacterium]MBN2677244.1 alpha-ribazole phosphatase [Anaerolineaceae bacterium]